MKTETSSPEKAQRRDRSIIAFFATSLAARGLGIGCQLLQVPISLRYLGNEAFGLWVTLFSFGFMLAFTDFGIGLGVQNHIAEALGKNDTARAQRIFVTGLVSLVGVMLALLAIAVPACLFADLPRLLKLTDPNVAKAATGAIIVVVVLWCANMPLGLGQRLAYAAQLGWTHNVVTSVSQAVMLGSVALGAWLDLGVKGFFIITFFSGSLINFCYLVFLLKKLRWTGLSPRLFDRTCLRDLSGLGVFFFLQQIATLVLFSAPPLILSASIGAAAVTPFNLTQRVLNLFAVIANACLLPIWPAYAEAKGQNDWAWIRRTLLRSIGIVVLLTIVPMVCAGPFIRDAIRWWTRGAAELPDQTLVWLLVAWNALTVLQQPFGFFLAGVSKVQRATIYSGLTTVVALGAIFLLIPRLGVNALPIGLLIGFTPFIFFGNIVEVLLVLRGHKGGSGPAQNAETPLEKLPANAGIVP